MVRKSYARKPVSSCLNFSLVRNTVCSTMRHSFRESHRKKRKNSTTDTLWSSHYPSTSSRQSFQRRFSLISTSTADSPLSAQTSGHTNRAHRAYMPHLRGLRSVADDLRPRESHIYAVRATLAWPKVWDGRRKVGGRVAGRFVAEGLAVRKRLAKFVGILRQVRCWRDLQVGLCQ